MEGLTELRAETKELFKSLGMPLNDTLTIKPLPDTYDEPGSYVFLFEKEGDRHVIYYDMDNIRAYGLGANEIEIAKKHECSHSVLVDRFPFTCQEDFASGFNRSNRSLSLTKDGTQLYRGLDILGELKDERIFLKSDDMADCVLAYDVLACTGRLGSGGFFSPEILAEYITSLTGMDELKKLEKAMTAKQANRIRTDTMYALTRFSYLAGLWLGETYGDKYLKGDMLSCFDAIADNAPDMHSYVSTFLPDAMKAEFVERKTL
jgi:hypothetical protein